MEGFIKLTAVDSEETTGVACEVKLHHISILEKAALLDAFITGLKMDKKEFEAVCLLRDLIKAERTQHVVYDKSTEEKEDRSPTIHVEIK